MCSNPQETVDLVTFTEEIHNGKLHFLCIVLLFYAFTWFYFESNGNERRLQSRFWAEKLGTLLTTSHTESQKIKGALSGLRQFLATESPLKVVKNAFYFTSKALCVLKICKFLSWLFSHVSKRLDLKEKVDFKFLDVTTWLTNHCNTHIAQCLDK